MSEIETVIVGTKFLGHEAIGALAEIRNGSNIRLQREPENKYDRNAVAVFFLGVKIGYVPRITNPAIAAAMDRQLPVRAQATTAAQIDERSRVKREPKITVSW